MAWEPIRLQEKNGRMTTTLEPAPRPRHLNGLVLVSAWEGISTSSLENGWIWTNASAPKKSLHYLDGLRPVVGGRAFDFPRKRMKSHPMSKPGAKVRLAPMLPTRLPNGMQ